MDEAIAKMSVERTFVDEAGDATPVEAARRRLDASISTLGDELDAFAEQLGPVLRPEGPEAAATMLQEARNPQSPLVETLGETRARVENLIARVQTLRARTEV